MLKTQRHQSSHKRQRGITAIEVMIALLILSFMSVAVLNILFYTRSVQILTHQHDYAVQIARDVLMQMRQGVSLDALEDQWAERKAFDAEYLIQFEQSPLDNGMLSNVELVIGWAGTQGFEQLVFNTTLPAQEEHTP